ncbi:pyridoxal-phosphate dependent enzyme [Candidatus Woesearchaeota archaeon]|nr:pyridoxal-phosphate dependent enzyme [Candidatus Woesearchaeota archaeon]
METNILAHLNPTEIFMAYDHLEGLHSKSPLIPFGTVHSNGTKVDIYAKMDTLNPGGSFKDRGSEYFVYKAGISGEVSEGDTVVTASAGNHAKGVAKAAKDHGLNAVVYMAEDTPKNKIKGTKDLGAEVRLVEGGYPGAAAAAKEFSEDQNLIYIPAYEHSDIILGQSTVVTEAMIQLYGKNIRPDFFVFPVGGGGLANGGGFAARYFDRAELFKVEGWGDKIHTYGVQTENFNTLFRSYHAGKLLNHKDTGETIADGIRVPNASFEMLQLSQRFLDDMFEVSEHQIRDAIRKVYQSNLLKDLMAMDEEDLKEFGFNGRHVSRRGDLNVVEGAAAAAFASVFDSTMIPFDRIATSISPRREIVGVVVASGNNIDGTLLEEILEEG